MSDTGEQPAAADNLVSRVLARIGNPLDYCSVDKAILGSCVTLSFVLSSAALIELMLAFPEQTPFFDLAFTRFFTLILYVMVAGWVAIIGVGLWLRTRDPENQAIVWATVIFYSLTFAWGAYCTGPFTAPYTALVVFGASMIAFLLFDFFKVSVGFAVVIVLVVGSVVLERYGIIPGAPLFAQPPYVDDRLSGWWIFAMGAVYVLLMGLFLPLIAYIIAQWRDREEKLSEAYVLLRATKDQLVQAESLAALGTLVSGAAHELRNPLASSGALFQSLREDIEALPGVGESERADALETIDMALRGHGRAAEIAERLYLLNEALERQAELRPANAVMDECRARHAAAQWDVAPLPEQALLDRGAALQIVDNLLSNALASGSDRAPRVRVQAVGAVLEIEVCDEGRGIPEKAQGQVFQPFFTLEKTGEGHGVGLGLYLVHELARRAGGGVMLQSTPGQGTCVAVSLRLMSADDLEAPAGEGIVPGYES